MTEPLKPYEPEPAPSYDYEYDYDDRAPRPRVLWGRVAALGIALLLAFLLGAKLGGGDDNSDQIDRLRTQLQTAQDENESLQTQLEAAQQPQVEVTPTPQPSETTVAEEPEVEGEEYVVQKGDTLRLIAQRKCGDPEAADLLAEVNDIADPTLISVGQTLIIPSDCGA
jgi:nucleoid-associated protein YgaU